MSGLPSGRRLTGPAGEPPRPGPACCASSIAIGAILNNTTQKRIDAKNCLSSFRLVLFISILIPTESEAITLMLPDLKILFGVPVHRHANREWFRKCLCILDRRFVGEDVQPRPRQ